VKTTDVHGRPVVNKHQALEETRREVEAEQDQEDTDTLLRGLFLSLYDKADVREINPDALVADLYADDPYEWCD